MTTDNEYSDEGFWDKVVSFAKAAGKEVIEKSLWLYYAAQDPSYASLGKRHCLWCAWILYSSN